MHWTKEKPTKSGYYWHYDEVGDFEIVELSDDSKIYTFEPYIGPYSLFNEPSNPDFPDRTFDGYWLGPIELSVTLTEDPKCPGGQRNGHFNTSKTMA